MIDTQEIFKKIGFILNDLQDQYDYLTHHPEKVNLAEVQLMQANGDFLADHIKIYLGLYEKSLGAKTESEALNVNKVEMPIIPEMEEFEARIDNPIDLAELEEKPQFEGAAKFEFILNEKAADLDFEEQKVEDIFDRQLSAEEQEIINRVKDQSNQSNDGFDEYIEEDLKNFNISVNVTSNADDASLEEEETGPEPFLVKTEEIAEETKLQMPFTDTKQEVESDKKPNINELLANASGKNAHTNAPITDLKQAINLNDKLLFIRDLFNGYNLAYAEAIDIVNKMSDFASADAFLKKTYAEKNLWAEKEQSVERFYDILARRFPQHLDM